MQGASVWGPSHIRGGVTSISTAVLDADRIRVVVEHNTQFDEAVLFCHLTPAKARWLAAKLIGLAEQAEAQTTEVSHG